MSLMRWDMYVLYVLLRLSGRLPLRLLHGVGTVLGCLAWRWRVAPARVIAVNLAIARSGLEPVARNTLGRATLIEAGKSVMEIAKVWGGGARRALALVAEVRGVERFRAALATGRGVIIAAPHLGCWELLNYWLCSRTPMTILYRPPRQAALEPLLCRMRGALAPEQVRASGHGMRALYRRLATGGAVGILPDQKPREGEGQCVPFFGRKAWTMSLLPRLAARTGATVLFAFAERLAGGRGYRIHFLPAPEGLYDADKLTACAALNRGVEACVRQAWAQYQWHYRRYSGQGLIDPYA